MLPIIRVFVFDVGGNFSLVLNIMKVLTHLGHDVAFNLDEAPDVDCRL